MAATLEEMAYNEACHSIDYQAKKLESLISRSSTVLAAAAAAAAFLGAAPGHGSGDRWLLCGLLCSLVVVATLTALVVKSRNWTFTREADQLVQASAKLTADESAAAVREWQRRWAAWIDSHYKTNQAQLLCLYRLYGASLIFLVLEVILGAGRAL